MAFRDSSFQDLRVPLTWTGAVAAIIAIGFALVLLLNDQRDAVTHDGYGARSEFDLAVAPVSGVLAAPVRWVHQASDGIGGYFFAVSENKRLKQRVAELERWRDAAIALKNINTRYEALLQLRTEPPIPMVSARVVADARGPFSNARLADAGTERGVKVGNPAMSERGVIGRVVGVSKGASRILLLTDVDSRTPVLVDRTNARAILRGDGGAAPRLQYVPDTQVREGDIILTSGDGGLFPRGLPVGVARKDLRGVWRVQLYSDQSAIDYVRILVFDDFSQVANQAALGQTAIPALSPEERAAVEAAAAGRAAPLIALPQPEGQAAPAAAPATAGSAPAVVRVAPVPSRPAAPRAVRPAAPQPEARPARAAPTQPAPAAPAPTQPPPASLDGLF